MLNSNDAIARRLVELAMPLLEEEALQLVFVINQLIIEIDAGHSCSRLSQIANHNHTTINKLYEIIIKSGLAGVYSSMPDKLTHKPLSLVATIDGDHLVYLSKYLMYELSVANVVSDLLSIRCNDSYSKSREDALHKLKLLNKKGNLPNIEQLDAIDLCSQQKFSIITGGPGTGKTTTVTLLLWLFYQTYGEEIRVRICAPTGKAALRVRESIKKSINSIREDPDTVIDTECFSNLLADNTNFSTIHKLLGYQHNSIYFKHNRNNKLEVDILIIDESSMVGLPLFSKLLQSLDFTQLRHIIFLGDPNQLSSVEEGYVFASLVFLNKTRSDVVKPDLFTDESEPFASKLLISNRNQGEIAKLAAMVLSGDVANAINLLKSGSQLQLLTPSYLQLTQNLLNPQNSGVINYFDYVRSLNKNIADLNYQELFRFLNQETVLCLTNSGKLGTVNLNSQIERQIKIHYGINTEWYNGRPIIILENDYSLELFNGDIGVCIIEGDQVNIVFESGRSFIPEILPNNQLAYAITIHKSQGSEYERVNIVLGAYDKLGDALQLLSRELLYTAITRAKTHAALYAETKVLETAIKKPTIRNSGLLQFLHS